MQNQVQNRSTTTSTLKIFQDEDIVVWIAVSLTRSGTVPSYCSKQKQGIMKKEPDLHSSVVDASRAASGNLLGGGLTSGSGSVYIVLVRLLLLSLCDGLRVLLVLVDGPVKDVIILEPFTNEQIAEDLAEV
jgi:hypothetical protein